MDGPGDGARSRLVTALPKEWPLGCLRHWSRSSQTGSPGGTGFFTRCFAQASDGLPAHLIYAVVGALAGGRGRAEAAPGIRRCVWRGHVTAQERVAWRARGRRGRGARGARRTQHGGHHRSHLVSHISRRVRVRVLAQRRAASAPHAPATAGLLPSASRLLPLLAAPAPSHTIQNVAHRRLMGLTGGLNYAGSVPGDAVLGDDRQRRLAPARRGSGGAGRRGAQSR